MTRGSSLPPNDMPTPPHRPLESDVLVTHVARVLKVTVCLAPAFAFAVWAVALHQGRP